MNILLNRLLALINQKESFSDENTAELFPGDKPLLVLGIFCSDVRHDFCMHDKPSRFSQKRVAEHRLSNRGGSKKSWGGELLHFEKSRLPGVAACDADLHHHAVPDRSDGGFRPYDAGGHRFPDNRANDPHFFIEDRLKGYRCRTVPVVGCCGDYFAVHIHTDRKKR